MRSPYLPNRLSTSTFPAPAAPNQRRDLAVELDGLVRAHHERSLSPRRARELTAEDVQPLRPTWVDIAVVGRNRRFSRARLTPGAGTLGSVPGCPVWWLLRHARVDDPRRSDDLVKRDAQRGGERQQ